MSSNKIMLLTLGVLANALTACSPTGGNGVVDLGPVGHGLEFLGLAVVLSSLVLVFGRFIGK